MGIFETTKDFKMTQTMQSCFILMLRNHKRALSVPVQKESAVELPQLYLLSKDNLNLNFIREDENKVQRQSTTIRMPKVDLV